MPSPTAAPTQTITPAPWHTILVPRKGPSICPAIDPSVSPHLTDFPPPEGPYTCYFDPGPSILDLLNRGASISVLVAALDSAALFFSPQFDITVADFTGDEIPEIVITLSDFLVLGCDNGEYTILINAPIEDAANSCVAPSLESTQDLNSDGLPDLLVSSRFAPWDLWQIFEWQGDTFRSLVQADGPGGDKPGAAFEDTAQAQVIDTDRNGTLELVIKGGIPSHRGNYDSGYPWRETTQIYEWDGTHFILRSLEYDTPQYRFQAVQDADRAALAGQAALARRFYEDAIASDTLAWWSPQLRAAHMNGLYRYDPTPTIPPSDPLERLSLAAYAMYRIMLLDVLQGSTQDAVRTYEALQASYGTGAAKTYSELARAFWKTYSTTHDISLACNSAVEFASGNRGALLTYLGSDYHGWQSLQYAPLDICPFTNKDATQSAPVASTPGA
jgi:hypothetical protein